MKAVIPTWKGQVFPGRIPDAVFTEVLADIFAMSFKQEFLFLDQYLYPLREEGFDMQLDSEAGEVTSFDDLDASSREERIVKVTTSIPGFMEGEVLGLASSDFAVRQHTLYAIYRVTCGWKRMPRMALLSVEILEQLRPDSQTPTYD